MDVLHTKKDFLRERLQAKFFAANNNKRVLIFGLGLSGGGVGAARFFARLGYDVTVTDMKPKSQLEHSVHALRGLGIRFVLGRHDPHDIETTHLIVKNPSVPYLAPLIQKAKKRGIPITNDGDLFLHLAPREKMIGITGTKGKTTTSFLIHHVIGKTSCLVGTPGVSFFHYFDLPREPKWIIAEFSSFDLERIRVSPHVAVFTSLFGDHLNRYRSFAEYAKTKMNIVRFQHPSDTAIVWKSQTIKKYLPKIKSSITWVDEKNTKRISPTTSWRVAPPSIALAQACTTAIGIPKKSFERRLQSFEAPAGRLEIVYKNKHFTWINDTTSTNPGAAAFSLQRILETFGTKNPITIITGGENKRFPVSDIQQYAKILRKTHVRIVFLAGSFTDILQKLLHSKILAHTTMAAAVKDAGQKEGIIALLPGATSFNLFQNEFDRARQFTDEAKKQYHS